MDFADPETAPTILPFTKFETSEIGYVGNGIIVEDFIATASVTHLPEILCAVELGWRNLRRVPPDRGAIPARQVAWGSGDHPVGDKGIDNFGRSTEAEVSESAVIHFGGMTPQARDFARRRSEEFLFEDPGRVLRTALPHPDSNHKQKNGCHDWRQRDSAHYFERARFNDEAGNK